MPVETVIQHTCTSTTVANAERLFMSDTHGNKLPGWIGVDLDGTLAEYHGWVGPTHIGAPVLPMLQRVRLWLSQGRQVRIVTARVSPVNKEQAEVCRKAIQDWLTFVGLPDLPITHEKDYCMLELWDDRCIQVIPNTGMRADGKP